jgi:beta-galactosidase
LARVFLVHLVGVDAFEIVPGRDGEAELRADEIFENGAVVAANGSVRFVGYVTVEITDASGNLMPDATNMVRFTLTGPGELSAVGSGAPNVMESFQQPQHSTFHGRALAIVRALGSSGKVTLRAEAEGLKGAETTIRVK